MVSTLGRAMYEGAGLLTAAGLAMGGYAYAALWPASQIFGPTLVAPERPNELALTFDDGPNPAWTPQLLEILAGYNAKATFFLVGRFAKAEPILTRYIADAGHAIGNHTWTHPNLAITGKRMVRKELSQTKDQLEQIIGRQVRLFRPPFGARRPAALRMAHELGMAPVLWNAMTDDWKEPSSAEIAARLSAKIERAGQNGRAANVVLHDGGHLKLGTDRGPSVTAAGMLLERYAGKRQFVTLEGWV